VPTARIRWRVAGTRVPAVPATGAPGRVPAGERDVGRAATGAYGCRREKAGPGRWPESCVCTRVRQAVPATAVEPQPWGLARPAASNWVDWDPGAATGQTECLSPAGARNHTGILFALLKNICIIYYLIL